MPAPRPLAILALLACGGCGDGADPWTAHLELPAPATAETRIFVVAWRGTVVVRNGPPGQVDVKATARVPVDWSKLMPEATLVAARDGARVVVDKAARDVDLDIEIAAPPGVSLTVGCASADVEIAGTWSDLQATTDGAVDARVDAKGGKLAGQRGGVSYVALGAGPAGEMRVESARGAVAATVPAAWNGQLKFQTRAGKLDVPPHKRLMTIWDEDKRGAVGRMGPPLRQEAPPAPGGGAGMGNEPGAGQPAPLPTIWAVSGTGDVSFRVVE